jgi:transposase
MSATALRNQRVLSRAQANFDARQPDDYYETIDDDEDEIPEDSQCPDCGGEINVEGNVMACNESCGWFEEVVKTETGYDGILGEG